jgi:hypothetical protein
VKKLICTLAVCAAGAAQAAPSFVTWTGSDATTFIGSIAAPGGDIGVTLSAANGGAILSSVTNSSGMGSYRGTLTAADVYAPDLPGTNDFIGWGSQSDATVYTLTFSRAVVDPVFHVFNLDYRAYDFLGGLTPTVISGFNLVASGSTAGDIDGATADAGGPGKGRDGGSAYGSFGLTGTFTSIPWTRPLLPGGYFSDGNYLGVSVSGPTAVPVPGCLALLALGLGAAGVVRRRHGARAAV